MGAVEWEREVALEPKQRRQVDDLAPLSFSNSVGSPSLSLTYLYYAQLEEGQGPMEMSTPLVQPSVVTLELEGPQQQRRLTVAFRFLLAIPHFVYLGLLGIVLFLAVVAAWFAALVTGRMPDGLGTFIARGTQYMGRVYAYGALLLTDRYPSFALDEPDYPVSVHAPYGGRLNRAAVLFRIVLVVPAAIVQQLVLSGLFVCLVFIWLIVLVAGRLPPSLFEAEAAVLRYTLRVYSYFAMLTSEYPRGLFGDKGLSTDMAAPSRGGIGDVFAENPPDVGPPPVVTKVVLSKAAKRLVVLFIVVGAIFGIGVNVISFLQLSETDRAREELNAAYEALYAEAPRYGTAVQNCAAQQAGLECLHTAATELQTAFRDFRAELRAVDMPGVALDVAQQVDEDAAKIIDLLGTLASTNDPDAYGPRTEELQKLLEQFDQHSLELDQALAAAF